MPHENSQMLLLPRVEKAFTAVWAVGSAAGPLYALTIGAVAPVWSAVLASVFLFVTGLWYRVRPSRMSEVISFLAFLPTVATHYAGIGAVIRTLQLPHMDLAILKIDTFLLGWLFPQGQVSLWMDQSPILNGDAFLGRVVTELFQLVYFTHYVWGYLLFFRLLSKRQMTDLISFAATWMGAYYLNNFLYTTVPVIGPIHTLKELYQHELNGFGMAGDIRRFILANQGTLEDCFPSGHTGIAWITAICALRSWRPLGIGALIAALLITLSTLILRYHYITDLMGAIAVIMASLWWGGWLFNPKRRRGYKASSTEAAPTL